MVKIRYFGGVGSYNFGTSYLPKAGYDYMDEQRYRFTYRTPSGGLPTGNVTITSFDPQAFTVTGTFEFTAPEASDFQNSTSPAGSITVTKGAFNLTF